MRTLAVEPRLIAIQGSPQNIFRAQLAIAQVDGWIVINNAEGIELIASSGVPIVTIGAQALGLDYPAVFPNNYAGMRAAVSHLIDHRHQRIAFIGDLANHDVKQRCAAMERESLQQTLQNAYERERGLANIVRELGSPVIPLLPEVLLIPLVGVIDSRRAQQIIDAVLQGVSSHQATTVLLDISGVPLVDTQVAHSLLQITRTASLLGARVILIGVRPEIAQSIVGLGINLHQFATQPTLAAAVQSLLKERKPLRPGFA